MAKIQSILAVVNKELHTCNAAIRGAALAKRTGGQLTLMTVVSESAAHFDFFHLLGIDQQTEEEMTAANEHLKNIAKTLDLSSEQLSLQAHWAHTFDQGVLKMIKATRADLVCVTPRDERCKRLSHAEWRLIHGSRVPILLAKNDRWKSPATIVASVDIDGDHQGESTVNQQIVQWACAFSSQFGALEVLHAASEPLELIGGPRTRGELVTELQSLIPSTARQNAVINIRIDKPNNAIADYSQGKGVDLVVMGVFARHGADDFLIGSTARKLLPTLKCDVLAVPTMVV